MKKIKTTTIVIKSLESILVIGYLLFEELIWNVFAKPLFQYFKQLALLNSLKQTFLTMNRYALLSIFIIILVITEVMGFLSGYLLVNGHLIMGITLYTCKIPIAAFTFWLFDLSKEKLLKFKWLNTSYQFLIGLIDKFVHSSVYIYTKAKIATIKARMVTIKSAIKAFVAQYRSDESFIKSIKSHYQHFKPSIINLFKR
ncbi:MAG: hypothetical protein KAG19_08550 [Methylococcales bacterium]|nr:hypothetical protein [Methylococcales bacterium]